jgi:hypothetical protein
MVKDHIVTMSLFSRRRAGRGGAPSESESQMSTPNTLWITVEGSGTAECDGLYCPSTAPEKVSESGTVSPLAASARAALPPF